MISTYDILKDRLRQLDDRRTMIPKYLADPDKWLGKNNYSMADIPKLEKEIRETETAITAIINHRKKAKS